MAKASYRLPWVSFSKVRLGARSFIKNEFHLRVKKTLFHKKGWAQRLTLKKSLRANWEIAYCSGITDLFTFSFFFQLSTWTSSGKSVDTTEKSALRSVKREICWKLMEIQLLKVAKFCRRFYGGEMGGGGGGGGAPPPPPPAHTLDPTKQTSLNFRNFPELYLRSLKTYHFQIWQHYEF